MLYARWKGLASGIKAGEYEIEPGTTPRALLEKMVSGQVLLHSFTIVDGWRVQDMLAALRRNPDIDLDAAGVAAGPDGQTRGPGHRRGGQFLPETYRFPSGTTRPRTAAPGACRPWCANWRRRGRLAIPCSPLHSAEELLIMASIVQKESGMPQELPKIAGLYLHRLRIGMRLQADPTVIYGLGERYDGELHTVDLRTDGPYNTYTRVGLPPTPIALAGAAAIRATRSSGENRRDIFRGLRPKATAVTYFPPRSKSTTPPSHNTWRVSARRRRLPMSVRRQRAEGFR